MIVNKMVPNVVLVFTSIAILNSFGIVSSQDELEYGLATNCENKGIKAWSLFQRFSKFVDKIFCFLAYICGDQCNGYLQTCECGDTTFNDHDNKYCCIQMNETCKVQPPGMLCKAT